MLKLSSRTLVTAVMMCCASLFAAPVNAAETTDSEAIVVTGQTPERVQQFVDSVSAASPMAEQLPRWDTSICTSLAGLPRRQAEFIADRVAQRAMAVGIEPGEAGCQANVSVIFTQDSDEVAQRMFDQDRQMFAYYQETNVSTLGQSAFNQFLRSTSPVRWWHVSHTVTADGLSLAGDSSSGGLENAPTQRASGTRLRSETREDLRRAIIIVDARRVGAAQLAALADYISMVALAQVDPAADTSGFPSILNLFAQGGEPVTELTQWDLAYLDGLYNVTRAAASAQQQEREIARHMSGAQTP
ncbi:MAG: hypothetical protein H7124_09965 [Phycisphaerales bacterium]|nr:hypothetical protein [Hyphomonadaceae bacterium]